MAAKPVGAAAGPAPLVRLTGKNDEMCPVCKTLRYIKRDLEFLVNPECYHPICTSCVARMFGEGPNQCPYAGCGKTLRRRGFRAPFFDDMVYERDRDVRRRVLAVFNRTEDEFETTRDFNDYSEMVEQLIMDLQDDGNPKARRKAEQKLDDWAARHKAQIEANRKAGAAQAEAARQRADQEREAARRRRVENARQDAAERLERERLKEEAVDHIRDAAEGEADAAAARVMSKRHGAAATGARSLGGDEQYTIRGLKKRVRREDNDGPYDPFGGLVLATERFTLSKDGYPNEWLAKARMSESHQTGGFDVDEYVARCVFDAFSGLGVVVGAAGGGAAGTNAKRAEAV